MEYLFIDLGKSSAILTQIYIGGNQGEREGGEREGRESTKSTNRDFLIDLKYHIRYAHIYRPSPSGT